MDVRSYLSPLIKWWWLLLVSFGLAIGTSYYIEKQQPPIYKSTTTMLIGQMINNPNPSNNDFFVNQQLATFYADIAKQDPVRTATMTALGLQSLPVYDVLPLPNSQLLEISVTDQNPEIAYRVATELANQLILKSPSNLQSGDQTRQAFIKQQMDDLQKSIVDTGQQIYQKQQDLGKLTSAKDIADAQQSIDALNSKLSTLQTNFANLVSSSKNNASNTLSVIDPASVPTSPVGPNKWMIIGIAGLIGLALSGGAAFLLEYLDDSLSSPADNNLIHNLPILSLISEMEKSKDRRPYLVEKPRSVIAEAFRSLRATIELSPRQPLKTIFVTSPEPQDGKTSIAVNLALVFAQGGKRVILLDADLRNPCAHERLGLENVNGLGEVLTGKVDLMNTMQVYEEKNLTVIPAGDVTKLPIDKLDKRSAQVILKELTQMADVVIIDGTPLFVSEALIWCSVVDGVLLVVRPGHTRKSVFRVMVDQLDRMGVNILGVIFNRIRARDAGGYGRYMYYSASYYTKSSPAKSSGKAKSTPEKSKTISKNGKGRLEPANPPFSGRS